MMLQDDRQGIYQIKMSEEERTRKIFSVRKASELDTTLGETAYHTMSFRENQRDRMTWKKKKNPVDGLKEGEDSLPLTETGNQRYEAMRAE